MEKYLANSFKAFFNARSKLGYISDCKVNSLLITTFIYRLVFFDYRGLICESDYSIIERAINCLYGRNCLLPYRDYLKMGKLKIGEYTELAHKLCSLDTYAHDTDDAIKATISIMKDVELELQDSTQDINLRVQALEKTKVAKSKQDIVEVDDIQL